MQQIEVAEEEELHKLGETLITSFLGENFPSSPVSRRKERKGCCSQKRFYPLIDTKEKICFPNGGPRPRSTRVSHQFQ